MFAYCGNDAINFLDPYGKYRMIEGYSPGDVIVSNSKPANNDKISSKGLSIAGGCGLYGSVNYSVVSENGTPSYQIITVGAGGGFGLDTKAVPGASVSVPIPSSISSISELEKYDGWGVDVGGAALFASYDASYNVSSDYHYDNFSVSPIPGVDFYCLITYTWVIPIGPPDWDAIDNVHLMH